MPKDSKDLDWRDPYPDDWGDPIGAVPRRRTTPLARITEAFEEACKDFTQPVTAQRARMNANIKWLLSQGWSEEQISASFTRFRKRMNRNFEGDCWAYYMRHVKGLLR